MVVSKAILEKIKAIIEKHHAYILFGLGLTPGGKSIIEQIYDYNFTHKHGEKEPVKSSVPNNETIRHSKEHLNSALEELLEKQKALVISRILGAIRDENNNYKLDAQNNIKDVNRDESLRQIVSSLRTAADDANRNWERVVNTEISNAISAGSVDRIVEEPNKPPANERYVYRIAVEDEALCKYCKRFYIDEDGSPKVYRLSTLLSNGSNYGKKPNEWKPVATATHPNERCSQVLELDQGWKVLPSGATTFIGMKEWTKYITKKTQS